MAHDHTDVVPVLVDTAALDRLAGQLGDPFLMRRLIDAYERELSPRVEACTLAAECGDLGTLGDVAHRLVGTGAQLGVVALTDWARQLERAAVDADSLAADDALAQVVSLEDSTRTALLGWLAGTGGAARAV